MRARRLHGTAAPIAACLAFAASLVAPAALADGPPGQTASEHIASHASAEPLEFLGGRVTLMLFGAMQLDVMHDLQALGTPAQGFVNNFVTSLIPLDGSQAARSSNRTGFSVNQTQLDLGIRTATPAGAAQLFSQVNFEQQPTGGPLPRLYLLYGELGGLRVGIDDSTFENSAAVPRTLDFQGPNALPAVQNLMARYTLPLGGDVLASLALELTGAELQLPVDATPESSALNQMPDVILRLAYLPSRSELQLAGMMRRFTALGQRVAGTGAAPESFELSAMAWAGHASMNLLFSTLAGDSPSWFSRWFGQDSLQAGVVYGTGLGAYIQDLGGLNLDGVVTASALTPLRVFGAYGGLQIWWTDAASSNGTFGYVNVYGDAALAPSAYHRAVYVSGNLIVSPVTALDVGVEYLYGRFETRAAGRGHDTRLQLSTIWHFGI